MLPSTRIMYFIDGENIVSRYQAMVERGFVPQPNVIYEQDAYLWSPQVSTPGNHRIIRAYYYTSVTGNDERIQAVVDQIKRIPIFYSNREGSAKTLYPCVYKRPRDNRYPKAKGIDIQMTVDILTHVHQNNLDVVCLFSGDGDYQPILHEAIRYGKHVYVAAFSNGLNSVLLHIADEFIDLDSVFFDLNRFSGSV